MTNGVADDTTNDPTNSATSGLTNDRTGNITHAVTRNSAEKDNSGVCPFETGVAWHLLVLRWRFPC